MGEPRNPALSPHRFDEAWFAGMVLVPLLALDLTPGKQNTVPLSYFGCVGGRKMLDSGEEDGVSKEQGSSLCSLCSSLPQTGRGVWSPEFHPHAADAAPFWNHGEKLRKSHSEERHIILIRMKSSKDLEAAWERAEPLFSWSYSYLHNTVFCTGIEIRLCTGIEIRLGADLTLTL